MGLIVAHDVAGGLTAPNGSVKFSSAMAVHSQNVFVKCSPFEARDVLRPTGKFALTFLRSPKRLEHFMAFFIGDLVTHIVVMMLLLDAIIATNAHSSHRTLNVCLVKQKEEEASAASVDNSLFFTSPNKNTISRSLRLC